MVLKQFAKKLLSILALSLLLQATSESFLRVGTDFDLLLRNFIVFQNRLVILLDSV